MTKLTSLVSKLNMKMDRHESQYKPQVYQCRKRGQSRHRKKITNLETGPIAQIEINHIEAEEIMIGIIGQIIEIDPDMNIDKKIGKVPIEKMTDMTMTGKNIGEIIEMIIGKIMIENEGLTLEMRIGIIQEIIIETIQEKDLNVEEIEVEIGVQKGKQVHNLEHCQKIGIIDQDQNQDLGLIQE